MKSTRRAETVKLAYGVVDLEGPLRHGPEQVTPSRSRVGRDRLDSNGRQQPIEARSGGRIADAEVTFEFLGVAAARQEDPEEVALVGVEIAEVARCE